MPKCRICKTATSQRYGLTYACSIEHALEFAAQQRAKKVEKDRRQARQKNREAKQKIKTLAELCVDARRAVQKYARLRDAAWGCCICCGVTKIEDGAHYFPVGSKYRCARISLNPRQIHGACARCNRFIGGGNMSGYVVGLEVRYGKAILAELDELKRKADSGEDAPLTKEEVIEIGKQYRAMTRELERKSGD